MNKKERPIGSDNSSVFIFPDYVLPGEPVSIGYRPLCIEHIVFHCNSQTLRMDCSGPFNASDIRYALFPVPRETTDAFFSIDGSIFFTNQKSERFSLTIPVQAKTFEHEEFSVAPAFSAPPQCEKRRMAVEASELHTVLSACSVGPLMELPWQRPVPGGISSDFGLSRTINGCMESVHWGVDLLADDGDPVLAAAPGKIALCACHYLGGNTLVIDHGYGVFTLYMHFLKTYAALGQTVLRGEPIGEAGCSGRVTGSHLHWGLSVLGCYVDALPLLEG